MDNKSAKGELRRMLDNASKIAIFGHRNIDGDCLGSCLALGTLLTNQGKDVRYFTPDEPMNDFKFIEKSVLFKTEFNYSKSYDLLIFLDTGNNTSQLKDFRTANPDYFSQHTGKIVIDHHEVNIGYGDLNIIDAHASSACELLAEILFELYPDQVNKEIATYLFMGISTDTGHFFYDDDYGRTFGVAAKLLELGVDKGRLVNNLYRTSTLQQVQFCGHLIERVQQDRQVIYSRFSHHELDQWNLDGQHVEHIIPLMTSIDHDGVFLFFKFNETDSDPHLRCSLRTKSATLNVAEIAAHFGGGGHRKASGMRMRMDGRSVIESIQYVVDTINDLITQK